MKYHVQTTTDKGWQTYESFETKGEAIAHKEEWEDEFPEANIRIVEAYAFRIVTEDLMDKVVKWLEEEVRTNNEFTYDDYNSEVVDDLDVYLCRGRAECAESLLNQIKKWGE